MMVAKTRQAATRPNKEELLENVAWWSSIRSSMEKARQKEALKELIKMMEKNGGKAPYGTVDKIVKTYNSKGFKAITRQNLFYHLSKLKASKSDDNLLLIGAFIVTSLQTEGVMSNLTEEHVLSDASNTQRDSQNETQFVSTTNFGGHKKGSTRQLKKESNLKFVNVIFTCATLYLAEVEQAKKLGLANVPNGTLRKTVNKEEEKSGLSTNSILLDTIKSRVKRENPTANSKSRLNQCWLSPAL
jgi:hypothetical protein